MTKRGLDVTCRCTMDQNKQRFCRLVFVLLSIASSIHCADLTYRIPEEQPVNTPIGNILNDTEDLKNAINAEDFPNLRFSFLSEGNTVTSLFSLGSNSGDLAVGPNATLDREQICPFSADCDVSFDVVVQSRLTHLFRKISVLVVLNDVNDNSPMFPSQAVNLDVSEAVLVGASLPIEGASDKDKSQNNSLQSYEIEPSDGAFGISFRKNLDGTNYLNLIVKSELDHETKNKYSLRIIAKDGGQPPREGVLNVEVAITDVNDNVPKFAKEGYSVTVDENVPQNSVILDVHATDLDSGDNGAISYKLSAHQDLKLRTLFYIEPETGSISVKGDLEKEATEKYDVIVQAIDHALQPFTAQTIVTIKVRDVINSPPQLTVNVLSDASVSEYASLGAVVAHVAVKESDRGRNGIVICKLTDPNFFQLQGFDLDEYKVIVAKPLDSESTKKQNVTIVCEDAGSPTLSTSFSFEVTILDENDNSPVFLDTKYVVFVSENNEIGKSVTQVSASDKDSGQNGRIRYFLGPESTGQFVISPDDGIIRANVRLDYETHTFANFTVLAVDGGDPAKTASVQVSVAIQDVNDEHPKFSQDQFTIDVDETTKPGEIVSLIQAFDFESGKNGEIEYFLIETISSIPFTLQMNGSLILDQLLDYEKQQVFGFKVMAIDKGTPRLNSTAEVVIKVKDENDNVPIITFPGVSNYLINVTFVDNKGTVITRLRAIDYDSGANARLRFVITSRNDSGRFEIDSSTGEIYTTKNYNEKDLGFYKLIIGVKDEGIPPLAAHITVSIRLSQGNGTAFSGLTSENEQNVLITLSIVCVTIVLSAIIVLVIVIMRHRDRKRRAGANRPVQESQDPAQYDAIKRTNDINELKSHLTDDSKFGFQISLDKGAVLQNPSCRDNKTKNLNESRDRNLSSTSSGSQNSSECGRQEANDIDKLTALQLHHALLQTYKQTHGNPENWHRSHNVGDDVNSDASGETTTSDSGRGGSEEDICSHNGTQNFDEGDVSREIQMSNSSFQSYSNRGSSSPLVKHKNKDLSRNSARKHVTFRDPHFQNNSANHTPRDTHQVRINSPSYHNDIRHFKKPNILYAHHPEHCDMQKQNVGRYPSHNSYEQNGAKNSVRNNVLNESDYIPMTGGRMPPPRSWQNDSVVTMTTEDGDDRSTTTSGSYTVDEDRFMSIDYNQWTDVVV